MTGRVFLAPKHLKAIRSSLALARIQFCLFYSILFYSILHTYVRTSVGISEVSKDAVACLAALWFLVQLAGFLVLTQRTNCTQFLSLAEFRVAWIQKQSCYWINNNSYVNLNYKNDTLYANLSAKYVNKSTDEIGLFGHIKKTISDYSSWCDSCLHFLDA